MNMGLGELRSMEFIHFPALSRGVHILASWSTYCSMLRMRKYREVRKMPPGISGWGEAARGPACPGPLPEQVPAGSA